MVGNEYFVTIIIANIIVIIIIVVKSIIKILIQGGFFVAELKYQYQDENSFGWRALLQFF